MHDIDVGTSYGELNVVLECYILIFLDFIFGQQGIIMNKGKGLFGMTSRPRRRALRVSENYDDNHLWEDGAVYAGERLQIHATKWQDPMVLDHWGIGEDFNAFATAAGLLEFSQHPRETYEALAGIPLYIQV